MPRYQLFTFLFFFLGIVLLMGLLFWPIVTPVIFAAILAGAFYPLHHLFMGRFKFNRTLSSALVCIIIFLLVILPSIYVTFRLAREAIAAYEAIKVTLSREFLTETFFGEGYLASTASQIFALFNAEYSPEGVIELVLSAAGAVSGYILNSVNNILGNIFLFLFQFFIMFVVAFALFQEGSRLKTFLLEILPLPREDKELVIERFNQMNFATLVGNGIGGLLQGILAGIAFWLAGFQSVLFWTVVMVILAFIPLVGMSFVYLPASIYLIIKGHWVAGLTLFLWCSAVALLVENYFKPRFVGARLKIHSAVVFLAIIGGMQVFGVAGIFYGPLIVILFLTFVQLYQEKYVGELDRNPEK